MTSNGLFFGKTDHFYILTVEQFIFQEYVTINITLCSVCIYTIL